MSVMAMAKDFCYKKPTQILVPILRAVEALQKGYSLTVRENIGDAYKLLTTAMATTKQNVSGEKTRGPRGPWVAHLRKRSKVTVDPIIENPRGII